MIARTLVLLFCLGVSAAAQEPSCLHLENDNITGKELARAFPEFGAIPAGSIVSAAPLAGSTHLFTAAQITSLAARYSIHIDSARDVCFDWAMEKLDRAAVLETMRASLGIAAARIEIAELTLDRVPKGQVEFPRELLGKPAAPDQPAPVLWRGRVTYGGAKHFAIWAKVRITVPVPVVVAKEMLKSGQPVRAEQIKTEQRDRFPEAPGSVPTAEQVAGMLLLRSLTTGAEIRAENLAHPNDVSRGEMVAIEVRSGRTRLMFAGRAESAGRTGDMIAVRNPESNRIFRAKVSAKGKAVVEPDLVGGY